MPSGGEGSYRRALALGAALAVAMYGLVLLHGRSNLGAKADAARSDVQLVELVREVKAAEVPLETTVREASSAEAETVFELPDAEIPQTISDAASASGPTSVLQKLEPVVAAESPATTYATVSDLLDTPTPKPRPLRPIDDRPVEVLATVGGRTRGGIAMGGGECGPVRPSMLVRAPFARVVVRNARF